MEHISAAEQVPRISFKIEVAAQRLRHLIQQAVVLNHLLHIVCLALRLAAARIIKRVIVTLTGILSPREKNGLPAFKLRQVKPFAENAATIVFVVFTNVDSGCGGRIAHLSANNNYGSWWNSGASHMNPGDKECVVQEIGSYITAGTAEAVPLLTRTAVCGTACTVV